MTCFSSRMLHMKSNTVFTGSSNLRPVGPSVVCIVSFFVIGWATTRTGDASVYGAVAACWLGATARRIRTGRGLFLGMFRSSTESPYKASHLGGWWKVGYQRRRSFFSTGPTRLHLVNTSPPHILTPRTSWSRPWASSAVASRCRSSLSHLDFFLETLSCATLPSPASLHSVLLPYPHLFYISNEGSEHFTIASHRQGFRATPRWEITPAVDVHHFKMGDNTPCQTF